MSRRLRVDSARQAIYGFPRFPSLAALDIGANGVKRPRSDETPEASLEELEAKATATVYRGASGEYALEKCLEGGHFSWLEETAEDYATSGVDPDTPGYVIHATPLCLYLSGADFDHGAQWEKFYGNLDITAEAEPVHWDDMLDLVPQWQAAIDSGATKERSAEFPRTKDGLLQSMCWHRPQASVEDSMRTLAREDVVDWSAPTRIGTRWKEAVQAAIEAAPWHIDVPQATSEFVCTGGRLQACVEKVVEYWDVDYSETVYTLTAAPGSQEAGYEFARWFSNSLNT